MNRPAMKLCSWMLLLSVLLTGCQPMQPYYLNEDGDFSHYLDVATEIEYPDVCHEPLDEVTQAYAPRTIANPNFDEHWDLTLEEAIAYTLQNAKVLRTVGVVRSFGQLLGNTPERISSAPDSVATIYDPAIQETSQAGVEQALANFDAIFSSSVSWDNTDRLQNFSQGVISQARVFQQDDVRISNEFSKLSANGSQWFFRNLSNYSGANNRNTADTRAVPSDWFTAFESEFRQPLLRNRGTQVNRIPLLLARIRTDQSLVDFEVGVMEVLFNVEQAYWELYFTYHNLQAAKFGRDSALSSYQKVEALYSSGEPGGEAEKLTQTKEQFFFFRVRVEEAQRDLFKAEANLRYLMGLAPTDHRLIRPSDRPARARVEFDWNQIVEEGRARSPQLRRLAWRIQQRELELIAARNQLLPQFDVVGLYRWLGQGDQFNSVSPDLDGVREYPPSAVDDLWSGTKQEFRLAAELNMPLGFRRELSQVRSSQLALARERARLEDAELELVHQLTDAINKLDASYKTLGTNANRLASARQQVVAVEAAFLVGTVPLDILLDAQRRQADATIAYFRNLVEHNLNLMLLHLRKGSLIEYDGVVLAEGPWPQKAYFDAVNEARRRDASYYLDYGYTRPRVISAGPVSKRFDGEANVATDVIPMVDGTVNATETTTTESSRGEFSEQLDEALDAITDEMDVLPAPKSSRQPTAAGPTLAEPESLEMVPPARQSPRDTPSDVPRETPTAPSRKRADPELDLEANRQIRTAKENDAVDIQWRD